MENTLLLSSNFLVLFGFKPDDREALREFDEELYEAAANFCGTVICVSPAEFQQGWLLQTEDTCRRDFFFAGDLYGDGYNTESQSLFGYMQTVQQRTRGKCKLLRDKILIPSDSLCERVFYEIVDIGEVPLKVHNVGLFVRSFEFSEFTSLSRGRDDYFRQIERQHTFYELTDSNKPSAAYRRGVYLSEVTTSSRGPMYQLLRCSSNLKGPTEMFRDVDRDILWSVQQLAGRYFDQGGSTLNHVLAQIYYNQPESDRKARIKEHSDKTKDMPYDGLMAFCSFYDFEGTDKSKISKQNYDWLYEKKTSVLTRMRFKLKDDVAPEIAASLERQFEITLYPNSVFLMSLTHNRYYTHAIVPSLLPAAYLPTRMGYVIRSSCTSALYCDREQKTFVIKKDRRGAKELVPLERDPSEEDVRELKERYFLENTTSDFIDYDSGNFYFSLNEGDYLRPRLFLKN